MLHKLNSLFRQLSPGGLLIAPVLHPYSSNLQSLSLFTRLESVDPKLKNGIRVHADVIMHCSYAPLRDLPPGAEVDDFTLFLQETEDLAAERLTCSRKIEAYADEFKKSKSTSTYDGRIMRKRAELKATLTKYSQLSTIITRNRKIIAAKQSESEDGQKSIEQLKNEHELKHAHHAEL